MAAIPAETAQAYLAAGLSCLPASRAKKRPALGGWKTWQSRLPTETEVRAWFANAHDAICIVAGKASGNLECIDFDNHGELFAAWMQKVDTALLAQLVIEQTPSGGYHVCYRVGRDEGCGMRDEEERAGDGETEQPLIEGNLKLARGIRDGKEKTLIETRGEGGLFLCAPTEGYALQQGDFTKLAVISPSARNALVDAARSLDELPAADCPTTSAGANVAAPGAVPCEPRDGGRWERFPGDDYNARGDFRELLRYHGWQFARSRPDGNEDWTRPGKNPEDGISATYRDGCFYVFSSNAAPFEPNVKYSPFAVYATLRHGGDFTAAAADLVRQGYGKTKDPLGGVTLNLRPTACAAGTGQADDEDSGPAEAAYKDPGPMPDELFEVPGFISRLMDHTLRTAPYPNFPLAFAGAFAMAAHLAGRRFRDEFNTRPNVYVLSLAASGSGKQHPRSVNVSLAAKCGFAREMGDYFASGEGLEDAMALTPAMLFQMDEADTLFNTVKMEESRAEMLNSMLLRFFSESSSGHVMRKRALARGQSAGEASACIQQPHLTLLGTAVPQFLYAALSERVMANGLLARCIVLEANARGQMNESPFDRGFDKELTEMVSVLRRRGERVDLLNDVIEPEVVPMDEDAKERRLVLCREGDARYTEAERTTSEAAKSLWARVGEKAMKCALVYAISENPKTPRITAAAMDWAHRFVFHSTERMLFQAATYVYDGEFDRQMKKVRRKLAGRPDRALSHRSLLQGMHMGRDELKKIIETMVDRGDVEIASGPKGGIMYKLRD